ncbi:hypothetical protein BDZ89DRAFT_1173123 [Hymenopellis radicata]|nr:hypothetical protein BDZ89DRAFT_1173123 [Hymenopellis radicata]
MPAGRPRGSKDGPRPPDAPPRGRPRKSASEPASTPDIDMDPLSEDDEFDFADSEWDDAELNIAMDKIEKDARAKEKKRLNDLRARRRRFDAIKNASSMSRHLPFFNHLPPDTLDDEDSDEQDIETDTETEMSSAVGNDSNDKEDKEARHR